MSHHDLQVLFNSTLYSEMNDSGCHTGKKIENYIFNYSDSLGKGNFSKCYKARNTITNEYVAIKIVEINSLKSKKLQELLYSEIEVLRGMNHPNVLKCLEVFTSHRNCYIVTQLCNQGDLDTLFKQKQKMTDTEIRTIIADIYRGLQYIASKNIIHRDLKIANVFMHNGVAKIADFGFALHCTHNFKDLNIGSPLYMAPEGIIDNTYGPKTDVWSFGVILYELYHGHTPFSYCKSQQQLRQIILRPLQSNQFQPYLPPDAKELILYCLQVRQDKRPLITDLINTPYLQQALHQKDTNISMHLSSTVKSYSTRMITINADNSSRSKNKIKIITALIPEPQFISNNNSPHKNVDPRTMNLNKTSHQFNQHDKFNQDNHHNLPSPTKNIYINASLTPSSSYGMPKRSISVNGRINNSLSAIDSSLNIANATSNRQPSQYLNKPTPKKYLISNQISFKQCVSLLHYCRLIFKYLQLLKQLPRFSQQPYKQHYALLAMFLVKILNEIYEQVTSKKIRYEGQNAKLRQKKLHQVTQQYRNKYDKQLNQDIVQKQLSQTVKNELSLTSIVHAAANLSQIMQIHPNSSVQQLIVAQLLLTIYSSSRILQDCYLHKNYQTFATNKQIQDVLNKRKDQFTYLSYTQYKNKLATTHNLSPR